MEEEKAAAYYDELTRKGSGAARFKQGLGFSDDNRNDVVPERASALPSSSSSFLSSFIKASDNSSHNVPKKVQIESIQNKLKKKPPRVSDHHTDNRYRNLDRDNRDRDRDRDRYRDRERRERDGDRDRDRDRERGRRKRSRSRSVSPSRRNRRDDDRKEKRDRKIDYAKLIDGYEHMSPAERVKAKMKLQLSSTAKQDEATGMGSGWERFNFDKDAPLDDEEIEAAEDDGALVKHIGQTFRFSAVEARREEKIKATHDEAMFGTSSLAPPVDSDSEAERNDQARESPEPAPVASLISDQVRSAQQGSWRDRIRKA
uniref:zinc finger CCCH domain-containing protein 13 n=1 Tax=Erigeron canadensis TaxID=72917 RepID=UPI001CB952EB|nr:zinc finger CCCH domain-containing protein 13 [Erigeron canadensis]